MTKPRKRLLIAVGVTLAALNVWRWTGGVSVPVHRSTADPAAKPSSGELVLHIAAFAHPESTASGRDLFRPKLPPVKRVARLAPPPPPPKSPEQLAEEQARVELAEMTLLAVALRNGRGEAFVLANGSTVTIETGSLIGNRFVVERITPDSIDVRDPATQVSGQLTLVGK